MRRSLLLPLAVVCVAAVTATLLHKAAPANCRSFGAELQICALSEMAKFSDTEQPRSEHPNFAIADGPLRLEAARNETVSLQWLLSGPGREGLSFRLSNFVPAQGAVASDEEPRLSQFLAHYHQVDRGGYSWGPQSQLLPWPAAYPDALIPQRHPCNGDTLFDSVPAAASARQHTLLWQDIYLPEQLPAGLYRSELRVERDGELLLVQAIDLQLWPAVLPQQNSIDAVGEVYRSYRMEGAGEDRSQAQWRAMSNCYQQLAHAHRSTFLERSPDLPSSEQDWRRYRDHYGPMLDGSLFTPERGYNGPGVGVPVSVWRAPWPQPFDMKLQGPLHYQELRRYEDYARQWAQLVEAEQWSASRWFAYVFDEVDGPEHSDRQYLAMAHQQMALVQQAIDAGSSGHRIDLLWTSHSNPAQWREDPALDLRGKLRLWAPNAHAADPDFIAEQAARGDRQWFYHSGHPAVGVHSINASGIELRTWGVIAARYGLDGVLMWAVNLGNDDAPFADPSYKPEDDRFGNGVLVYPGAQLPRIGYPASAGAIPSIRLKSWRRGLQDFELIRLARQLRPEQTERLLQRMIPRALAEGAGSAAWPQDPASWIDFKRQLLVLASQP